MRRFLARRAIKAFGARYGYDVSYLMYLVQTAPGMLFRFAPVSKLAAYRVRAPAAAIYAAKIVGAMQEDCGPCAQLAVDMALEEGVSPLTLKAISTGKVEQLDQQTRTAYEFAKAIVLDDASISEWRDKVHASWGDAGVVDMGFAVQIGRVFPMIKKGLGFGSACNALSINRNVQHART